MNPITDYIQTFPAGIQKILIELRSLIQKAAPEASEKISYQMPTFFLNGNLVHFAAYQNHIGFYPAPSAITRFAEELKGYKTSKGAIRFSIGQPLPTDLIRRIVAFRVKENLQKPKKIKKPSP